MIAAGKEPVDDSKYRNYLSDLILLLKEDAVEAKKERDAHQGLDGHSYYEGKVLAYYEVISTMLLQAKAFGIDPEELNLGGIDPERDLL